MPRIHVAAPPTRTSSTGTAFPAPDEAVPTMAEWTARHHNRAPLWRRLFRKDRL